MSKLTVGDGFVFPDDTEQDTAGVVTSTGRDFYFNPAGDNSEDGTSIERAVETPLQAINLVNALVPPPSSSDTASINAAVTGTSTDNLVLPDSTSVNCNFASVLGFFGTNIEGGTLQESSWGALLNFGNNGLCYKIDSKVRHQADINAIVAGSQIPAADDVTGIQVSGVCDDIFIDVTQGELRGKRCIMVDHTSTTQTPVNYEFQVVEFFDIDQQFMVHNPGVGSAQTNVVIKTLGPAPGETTTGSVGAKCKSGILLLNAQTFIADMLIDVDAGAIASVDCQAVFGNSTSAGSLIFKSVGIYTGHIETTGAGSLQIQSELIAGNATNAGDMSIKTDQFDGDIVNNGAMFVIIGEHNGTLTNNGTINGIIGGVRYGNWAGDLGYILATWGANLQTAGRFPAINGTANATEVAGLGIQASAQVSAPGTIDTVTYYNATGDNTTVFKIIKNGVVAYTFTCTGFYGQEMGIGVPVAMVDNVAIEYDAGTAPGNGIYTMYIN